MAQSMKMGRAFPSRLPLYLPHSSGEWIESTVALLLQRQDMQGLGSATTYAKRYALASMVGAVTEEGDGRR
jgi:hypothetical protein